mgnify:CR=1 FL=1
MSDRYFCPKCSEFVRAVAWKFVHLNEGMKTCFACFKCESMVYLKDFKDGTEGKDKELNIS